MEGSDERPAAVSAVGALPLASLAAGFDAYLDRKRIPLHVAEAEALRGGYENQIVRLRLGAATTPRGRKRSTALAPAPERPLVLRLCLRPDASRAVAWEARAMWAARRAGVPVPHIALVGKDAVELGGAFLLIEFLPGRPLDRALAQSGPAAALRLFRAFSAVQLAIFRVPWRPRPSLLPPPMPDAFAAFPSLDARLAAAHAQIDRRGLSLLEPALTWLQENHRRLGRRRRVFLHGDCHPRNVLAQEGRITGVLDWTSAGFGDPHEDIGWTSMLLATASDPDPAADAALAHFRSAGRRLYLACVRANFPVDEQALAYCEVWAGLRWLLYFLPSFLPDAGPPLLNADAAGMVTDRYVERVLRFIDERL